MGVRGRIRQKNLPEKLKAIREALGLSQGGVVEAFGLDGLGRSNISGYELGRIEPPINVLLAYARAVTVCVEVSMDDELELPATLPAKRTFHAHSVSFLRRNMIKESGA